MSRDVLELAGSLAYLDELYQQYSEQPGAVDPSWRPLLDESNGETNGASNGHASTNGKPAAAIAEAAARNGQTGQNGQHGQNSQPGEVYYSTDPSRPNMPRMGRPGSVTTAPITSAMPVVGTKHASHVWPLVNAWRSRGHFAANLDPLGLLETAWIPELSPETWGFGPEDRAQVIEPTGVHGLPRATVDELVAHLHKIYAGSVGIEFMHISSPARRSWLAERMETHVTQPLPPDVRIRILELLINAEQFERFCHTKYPGTKRFSLEGSEALIPCLDLVLTHGARLGAIEAVMGMAHRGRLTTIEQIVKRPGRQMFGQFEDIEPEKAMGGGDVKYHMG
ncbi:MAG TPA: hypothetical protein VK427_15820, partial [Kofleriaceae bacterium]|nr:hypothetical protein [Kofleriaceae bacterium]